MIGGIRAAHSNEKWGQTPFSCGLRAATENGVCPHFHAFSCRANVHLIGVEGEPLLDHAQLVVGLLVAPDRVFRPAFTSEKYAASPLNGQCVRWLERISRSIFTSLRGK